MGWDGGGGLAGGAAPHRQEPRACLPVLTPQNAHPGLGADETLWKQANCAWVCLDTGWRALLGHLWLCLPPSAKCPHRPPALTAAPSLHLCGAPPSSPGALPHLEAAGRPRVRLCRNRAKHTVLLKELKAWPYLRTLPPALRLSEVRMSPKVEREGGGEPRARQEGRGGGVGAGRVTIFRAGPAGPQTAFIWAATFLAPRNSFCRRFCGLIVSLVFLNLFPSPSCFPGPGAEAQNGVRQV